MTLSETAQALTSSDIWTLRVAYSHPSKHIRPVTRDQYLRASKLVEAGYLDRLAGTNRKFELTASGRIVVQAYIAKAKKEVENDAD